MKNPCIIGRNRDRGPWAFLAMRTRFPRRDGVVYVAISENEIRWTHEMQEELDWDTLDIPYGCSFVSPQEPLDRRQQRYGQTIHRSQEIFATGFLTLSREDLGLENDNLSATAMAKYVMALLSGAYGDKTFFADVMLREFNDRIGYEEDVATIDPHVEAIRRPGESLFSAAARLGQCEPLPHWLDTFVVNYAEEQAKE